MKFYNTIPYIEALLGLKSDKWHDLETAREDNMKWWYTTNSDQGHYVPQLHLFLSSKNPYHKSLSLPSLNAKQRVGAY